MKIQLSKNKKHNYFVLLNLWKQHLWKVNYIGLLQFQAQNASISLLCYIWQNTNYFVYEFAYNKLHPFHKASITTIDFMQCTKVLWQFTPIWQNKMLTSFWISMKILIIKEFWMCVETRRNYNMKTNLN